MDVKVQASNAWEVICYRSTQSYTASQLNVFCRICAVLLKLSFGSNVIISHIHVPGYNMQKSEH